MEEYEIVNADCLEHMRQMEPNSIDAIVTDPPYGIAFMGAKWDSFNGSNGKQTTKERQDEAKRYAAENRGAPRYGNSHGKRVTRDEMVAFQNAMTPIFEEALRVAKPGAYLLCFGGTRTFHRMACAIEDAGWSVKDCIMYVYGSGFPHGMDVGKAIDKALGAERKKVTEPATNQAKEWDGWNTQIKPSWEPVIVAQKPLDGTVAHNVMTYGTGAINVDACRIPTGDKLGGGLRAGGAEGVWDRPFMHDEKAQAAFVERKKANVAKSEALGRYPANLVHDGSDEVLALFPESKGQQANVTGNEPSRPADGVCYGEYSGRHVFAKRGDSGSAARFFYCAKASKKERNMGMGKYLIWEQGQELTRLLERASNLLARDISESMMLSLAGVGCSTSLSGNESTDLSQAECRYITSTVIPLITESRTCSSSPHSNISESILDAIRTSEESGISLARLAEKSSQSKPGSTGDETAIATNAVSVLFDDLSQIRRLARQGNFHPTIKPTALMQWLVRLVCRRGGVVLDPFCGSGSTGVACMREGMRFVGIEREEHYCEISRRRVSEAYEESGQQSLPI